MYGSHCLEHWSKTPSALSLSTDESELHDIPNEIQVALGFKSMCADFNLTKPVRIDSDAAVSIGIARRRGLGKLMHLDVEDLWVQAKVRNKQVEICKVLGTDNPAAIFTKYVDAAILNKALKQTGLCSESGQPKT